MGSDNEAENETGESSFRWGGVPGRAILLDVSPQMWKQTSNGEIPVQIAFGACYHLIRRLMVDAPTHFFGLALFGTLKNDDKGLENVVQLLELKQPTVEDVQTLKDLVLNVDQVKDKWGTSANYNLADAFWQTSRMFSACKKKMNSQTATFISCFSEPDRSQHRAILKKASDLCAIGVEVSFVNVSESSISKESFYVELGSVVSKLPTEDYEPPEPTTSLEDILPLIYHSSDKKTASAKLLFHLGNDVKFGVAIYHLCKPKLAPKKVNLHRETNSLVELSTSTVRTSETGDKPVLRSELSMYQNYGDRNVELTHGELIQLRKFAGAPRIQLLGFKPASTLDMSKYYLKPCAFLYPDESAATGSTKLFLCLRDRCIAKERIIICLLISRWYSNPKLAALVPQTRVVENGRQVQSDGFHIIYLPYIDNIKEMTVDESSEVSEEQLECMKKIIKKIKFKYVPDFFENPKLQKLHNAIEALALDESEPRPIEDATIPDMAEQDELIAPFVQNFETLFGPFDTVAVKRTASDGEKKTSKKRAVEMTSPDLKLLAERIESKTAYKYTVPELVKILRWRNPPNLPGLTGVKKDQLLSLVYQYYP